jgi:uncharacterized repeat protein (TIGR02543 family)
MRNFAKKLGIGVLILSLILSSTPGYSFAQNTELESVYEKSTNPFKVKDIKRNYKISTISDKNAAKVDKAASMQKTSSNTKILEEKPSEKTKIIVKFKDSISYTEIESLVSAYDYEIIGKSENRLFSISSDSLENVKNALKNKYDYVETDKIAKKAVIANDPYFSSQWGLQSTKVNDAWSISKGSAEVTIAVIDSGVSRNHEDLTNVDIRQGWDYLLDESVSWDSDGHGTETTGVIAATANNSKGIAGICWNAVIIPLLVLDTEGSAYTSDVTQAIYDAADLGVEVINLSLGSDEYSYSQESAVEYAVSKGCIIVAAAGNDAISAYNYPASYDGVISVASVDNNLLTSSFSNYNDAVDVCAPGESIVTTGDSYYTGYDYMTVEGTSFSTAFVSGIAALLKAKDNTVDANQFHKIIEFTSMDLGPANYDYDYGYGLVNASKILTYMQEADTTSDFEYTLDNSAITITGYNGNGGNISIPNTIYGYPVTSVADEAFAYNNTITSVYIPANISQIGAYAFSDCNSLLQFTVDISNPFFSSMDGVIFSKDKKTLVQYPGGKQGICTIPSYVLIIGDAAFNGCNGITGVTIPSSITAIGFAAFAYCSNLTEITVDGMNLNYQSVEGVLFNKSLSTMVAFPSGRSGEYKIPESVTRIIASAFEGSKKISTVYLPQNLNSVDYGAFWNCTSLRGAYFSGNPPSFGTDVFKNTPLDFVVYYSIAKSSGWAYYSDYQSKAFCLLTLDLQYDFTTRLVFSPVTNGKITPPAIPVRPGYAFIGWYKSADLSTPWNFILDSVGGDTTIFAKWELRNYTVSYVDQKMNTTINIIAGSDTKLTMPAQPVLTGYTFDGWYSNQAFTTQWNFDTDTVKSDMTLYAKWIINVYTVTFNSLSGSAVSPINANYNTKIIAPKAPTRSGYTFIGWYKESSCINKWDFNAYVVSNITLYAKWVINYTFTFNSMGGSAVTARIMPSGSLLTSPPSPVRTGYTFVGWYRQSACTTAWNLTVDKITANITLYAKWKTALKVSIVAQTNSSTYGTVGGGGSYYNDKITQATVIAYPKAGYRFVRWLEGTTAVSTSYKYSFVASRARTLKAEFTKIGIPTITVSSAGYNQIKISWAAVAGAYEYEIYRATSSAGTYTKVSYTKLLTYTNTGLSFNTTYYYKVRLKCVTGTIITYGAYSSYKSAKTVISTPTGLSAVSASYNSIKLSWVSVSGASGYLVYRAVSSTGTYSLIATVTTNTYTSTSLNTGTIYYFKIVAYRLIGTTKVTGGYSAVVNAKSILNRPSSVSAAGGSASIYVTWGAVSGANGYQIYRSSSSTGTYTSIATATTGSYNNTGLTAGVYYYYKIAAYRTVGTAKIYSAYSDIVSSTARNPVLPEYYTFFSSTTDSYKQVLVFIFYNTGTKPIRIYRENAFLKDRDYSGFDRDLILIDENADELLWTEIAPGSSAYISFVVSGTPTWYDQYTKVYFQFTCDGVTYYALGSSYYGDYYVKM